MQKFSFLRGWVAFLSKKKLFFHAKYQILRGWVLFLVPFFVIFLSFFLNVLPNSGGPASAAVRVPKAVNADSRRTPAGCWTSLFRLYLTADLLHPVACERSEPSCEWWNDEMMNDEWWSKFWVFDLDKTFICYSGCLNLNCYMSKKVHENFLMGLKVWWSWGSRFFFSKSPFVGRF